jgi:hypothetical protein
VEEGSIEAGISEPIFKQDNVPESERIPMTRIRFGRLTTVGLAVALTLATTHVRADSKQAIAAIEAAIKKNGRIPFGGTPAHQTSGAAKNAAGSTGGVNSSYLKLARSLHKATPQRLRAVSRATNQSSTSTVVTVGTAPSGFGKEFDWDRSQPSCLVAVFINVADPLGVSITGLQAGDTIQIMSASGICSFSKSSGDPTLSSIIGLVADGTEAVVDAETGSTSANSAISDAAQFAQGFLKGGAAEMFRDPFGVEPSSGGISCEQGGVVVCLPQGEGTYYSGDGSHRTLWATMPRAIGQARTLPSVYQSMSNNPPFFFLGHNVPNVGTCTTGGVAYILAWDSVFTDNAGSYQLFVKLTRGGASTSPSAPASPAVARKARTGR